MASPKKDRLLEEFRKWEIDMDPLNAKAGGEPEEFQIWIPVFNITLNIIRECLDGTDCNYMTYSDNGQGGIYQSFTWDED